MARKKTEVPVCEHPMEKAFKEERGDGSGKWDLICGECGFTICEVANPNEEPVKEVLPCVNPEAEECQHGAEEMQAHCGEYSTATTYVCTREDCGHYGQDIEGRTCYRSGEEATGECVAYVSGEQAATSFKPCGDCGGTGWIWYNEAHGIAKCDDCGQFLTAAGEPAVVAVDMAAGPDQTVTAYVSRDPDKIGGRFQELLPVPVDDSEMAHYGVELAEKHKLWLDTKVKAKAFAKASKEIADRCEREMIEIAEIIQDQARTAPVDVHWEYDFTMGVKRKRRLDTWDVIGEETLTVEERQPSFDFTASQEGIQKLKEAQEGAGDTPLTDDPQNPICDACQLPITEDQKDVGHECSLHEWCAEQSEASFLTDEETAAQDELDQVADEHPVIDINDAPADKNRTCCFPSDRGEIKQGDIIVTFCKVCGLIHKKAPVGGDPWDTVDFTPGEKVDLDVIPW